MSFRLKIDKLLESNTLGINSVNGLEKHVGASTGAIKKYYDKDEDPGIGTIKKIKKALGISDKQWSQLAATPNYPEFEDSTTMLLQELKEAYKANADLKDELIKSQAEKIDRLNEEIKKLKGG